MMAHRLRRRPKINPTLTQSIMFAGASLFNLLERQLMYFYFYTFEFVSRYPDTQIQMGKNTHMSSH